MKTSSKQLLWLLASAVAIIALWNLFGLFSSHATRVTTVRMRDIYFALSDATSSGSTLPDLPEGPISRLYADTHLRLDSSLPRYDGWGGEFRCITRGSSFVLISLGLDHRADPHRTAGAKPRPTQDLVWTDDGFWSYPTGLCGGLTTQFDSIPFERLLEYEPNVPPRSRATVDQSQHKAQPTPS